jgi:translation initiation factor 3 subunit G
MASIQTSQQWADDDVDVAPQITTNPDGTKTVVTYKINEEGQKVKVTQKIKEVIVQEKVNKEVASRKRWAKYGAEKGAAPGPDFATTQIGDVVELKLGTSWKEIEREEEKEKQNSEKTSASSIKCRTCGGAHFTSKCPYKDTLGAVDPATVPGDDVEAAVPSISTPAVPGRYVPAHLRSGRGGLGLSDAQERRDRDDSTTLKISQLNEIVDEQMLRDTLLANFGQVARVNIVRNRETGRSKGLAFVQFYSEQQAQQALERLNGKGFHNLILQVEWSKPKK